jgi:hypothetical protein
MIAKKEIRKLIAQGNEPREIYKQLEGSVKTEAQKDDLAEAIAKTAIKSTKGNIFNYIYLALIILATFFEIYTVFSSDLLKNAFHQSFVQQINSGDSALNNVDFDSFLRVMRIYFSLMVAIITGIFTYFFIRKNLIMYRFLYITNVISAILFTLISLSALVKVGFSLSELINCVLSYLLIYLNYKIIELYFPYLNIIAGLKTNKDGKYLITN